MTRIMDAIQWSGQPVISLFVVTDSDSAPPIDDGLIAVASSVQSYNLVDNAGIMSGLHTYEYDLTFATVPPDLEDGLGDLLRQACMSGARVAWLGLEGSFDFLHILEDDVSDQIYGVCIEQGEPVIELDDEVLRSPTWRTQLRKARRTLQ